MDKTNVRKNPFGSQNTSSIQEPFRNVPPTTSNVEPPPRGNTSSTAMPPPKNTFTNKESEQHIPSRPAVNANPSAISTNQNSEIEKILKEYENLKIYNSSKGFIRPTTER